MEVDPDQLKQAIESRHGGRAALLQSVPVREIHGDTLAWEGVVHIFVLAGHPAAARVYAWTSSMEGSDRRRFYAVLHVGGIQSPQDAVRAAIVTEREDI
jgi:hypothetical protein